MSPLQKGRVGFGRNHEPLGELLGLGGMSLAKTWLLLPLSPVFSPPGLVQSPSPSTRQTRGCSI